MRTTVNLDEDVLFAVHERARRQGRSIGAVLSELARNALIDAGSEAAADHSTASGFGFEPLAHRGPAVSNAQIDRLREDEPA